MSMLRRIARLAGALALMGAILSCTSTGWPTAPALPVIDRYDTPEWTLRTLERAFAAKRASSYAGCFADSTSPSTPAYHQHFDHDDRTAFESSCGCVAPPDWGYAHELEFFAFFTRLRPSDRYSARFDAMPQYPDPTPTDTQALLVRHYQVIAIQSDETAAIIAVGWAALTFTRTADDRWVIREWTDHRAPLDPGSVTFGHRRLESTR